MTKSTCALLACLLTAPMLTAAAELKEGGPAPAFSARGDDGKAWSLSGLAGKYVVLYFYPKDDTPGCTVEAQNFRDDSAAYEAKGAVVLGVSMDSAESHKEFRAKHGLKFPLLVGTDELAKAYGVPVRFGFASRQTFVIGKDGKLLKAFRDVEVQNHSKEILALLK
jgi:peroxiredoxin Q/BCP